MTTLGKRIRELRIAEPYMTQRQLAAVLSVTPPWLSQVEADRIKPPLHTLPVIAGALNADVRELSALWQAWWPAPAPNYSASICSGREQP